MFFPKKIGKLERRPQKIGKTGETHQQIVKKMRNSPKNDEQN
jgi:hypothetical protein